MNRFRHLVVLNAMLVLCGCSAFSYRFPWQSAGNRSQKGQIIRDKSDRSQQVVPPLIELTDSGLQPVAKAALSRCSKHLSLLPEQAAYADRTNFGERESKDAWGRPLKSHPQVIVLHETVISAPQTIALFKTPHSEDNQQFSYHLLIDRDGTRLRIVPDDKRAFGAGMSAFGDATQRTKPTSVGSINNIALHVSLVSPEDGRDDRDGHSGYTEAQYRALAGQVLLWQAAFGIPMTRVTTHAAVDRSHSRYDPRSFRWHRFDSYYQAAAAGCGFTQFDNQQAGL